MPSERIAYKVNAPMTVEQFIDILNRSTLWLRRPVDDRECMEQLLENTSLMISAWDGDVLVGIARSVTDFAYACYLADLAVDERYQRRGIGRTLVTETRKALGPRCRIRLLSAPPAVGFYQRVGFTRNDNCWELR